MGYRYPNVVTTMHSRHFLSRTSRVALPVVMGASLVEGRTSLRSFSSNEGNKDKPTEKSGQVFDITKKWADVQDDARDFWKSAIFTSTEEESKKPETKTKDKTATNTAEESLEALQGKMKQFLGINNKDKSSIESKATTESYSKNENSASSFREMAGSFASLLAGGGSEATVQKIVQQARESAEEGDVADKKSLDEMMDLLKKYSEDLKKTADKFLGDVDLTKLYPTSLFYFIEYEDSVKNPSWKRRMHRFYPGIDIDKMDELNHFLQLADLAYADTVEEIQEGLESNETPYEVVWVDTNSRPNDPAHYIAVKRAQTYWSPYLEVLLVVRGTKTIGDALTDLLCEDVPYRGGKAHSGILEGGQHLVEKHKEMLLKLLESSGKRKVKLTCVGHSLGAGCASIIGMELRDDPKFEVEVIGFGCPALVSKDLSEKTKSYITTVVADDDCVPRLSAPSVVNALLDIMEHDYLPSARRDVQHAFKELQRLFPGIITKGMQDRIMNDILDPLMNEFLQQAIKEPTEKRMEPVLFPPGKVIHFYRDGVGVTGSVVPCDFFGELLISRRMVDDHLFFTGYQQIFLELMRQYHRDHNFTFDSKAK